MDKAQEFVYCHPKPVVLRASWVKIFKDRQRGLKARTTTDKCKLSQFHDFYGSLEQLRGVTPEFSVWSMSGVRIADTMGTWTNFIGCVSATGDFCPPFVLFNGGQNELDKIPELKTWKCELDPFNINSPSTSQEDMAVKWLKQVFQPYTLHHPERLLVMDFRYISEEFLSESEKLRIHVLVLPPDSQYVAQPLEGYLVEPLKMQFQKYMLKNADSCSKTTLKHVLRSSPTSISKMRLCP